MFFKYTWNVNKDKPLSGSFKKIIKSGKIYFLTKLN